MTFEELEKAVKIFIKERDWEQFEKPKDLILTLAAEVGELAQHYQWVTDKQEALMHADPVKLSMIGAELADIQLALINLSHTLNIDLIQETKNKLVGLKKRYPVENVKGKHNNHYEGVKDAMR